MITKFFIELVMNLSFGLFSLISSLLPSSSSADLTSLLTTILNITHQSTNFLFFIFGDWLFVILPVVVFQFTFKLVILPIISFIRGFIRFGSG